jgi:PAS domain S-box-containing protein
MAVKNIRFVHGIRKLADQELAPFCAAAQRVPPIGFGHSGLRQAFTTLERSRMGNEDPISPAGADADRLVVLEQQLGLVTTHVLEVLCELDADRLVRSIHPSVERAFGFSAAELLGRPVLDLIHPDDRKRAEEALEYCVREGRAEVEVRCRHRDGYWVHLACFGGWLRDAQGRVSGIMIGGRNIVLRKKTQAELARLEANFQAVWDNSRDAMRLIDGRGILVLVNDAYCRLVQKPRDELVGQPFVVAYGYDNPEVKLREFQARFAVRTLPPRLDLELPLWTGEKRVFDLASSFLQIGDETLLLTIYRDITHRRQKEEELKELNRALRERAAQLGALTLQVTRVEQQERRRLAQIVHDHLQQLLVAARMTAERVRRRAEDSEMQKAVEDLEALLEESIRASRSITTELSPPILHDGGLIPALEWLARRMKEKHDLAVTVEAHPGAEPKTEALRVFLFQAVRELLFNCYKHAGVAEARVFVHNPANDKISLEVTDKGKGFDLASLKAGGDGNRDCFGLFSLQERMNFIGGSVTIVSAPGQGTQVTLMAPVEPVLDETVARDTAIVRAAYDRKETAEKAPAQDRIRLVLVDDHKIMRQGLRELLREQPEMEVVGEAENGLEGLKMVSRLRPDAVIMDITMPVLNGIEATRLIVADFPQVKVIGLSMHDKEDMAQAMLEVGAAAYVTKAAASETLTSTILACVKGAGALESPSAAVSERAPVAGSAG